MERLIIPDWADSQAVAIRAAIHPLFLAVRGRCKRQKTASDESEAVGLNAAGALLLCRFGFGRVRLRELAAEPVDATCGVDQLLLAREERVARRADFEHDVALVGRARLEDRSAGALDVDVLILRVNTFFWHDAYPFGLLRACGSLANGSAHRHIEVPVALPALSYERGCVERKSHFPHSTFDSHSEQSDSAAAIAAILTVWKFVRSAMARGFGLWSATMGAG